MPFTLVIEPTIDKPYKYICPFCNTTCEYDSTFFCSHCDEFLDLDIEFIEGTVHTRFDYYAGR